MPVSPESTASSRLTRLVQAVRPSSPPLSVQALAERGPFDPGRPGVRALAALAVLVALLAGGAAWWARPRTQPVSVAMTGGSQDSTPDQPTTTAQGATPTPTVSLPGGELVVAVSGKVRRPGLVRLAVGARVADAIAAAGGAVPGAPLTYLNVARRVSDGELIVVGEAAPAAPGTAAGGTPPGAKINLNTATVNQLDALPGVGPVMAQRLVEYRQQHGGFHAVADLRRVEGIGDTRFERLKDLVEV